MKNKMRPIHPGEFSVRNTYCRSGSAPTRSRRRWGAREPHQRHRRREAQVTADTALRLARAFKTSPELWLNLQQAFDLRTAELAAGRRCGPSSPSGAGARVSGYLLPRANSIHFHMNCQFAVHPVRDALPHYKGRPARFCGSEER